MPRGIAERPFKYIEDGESNFANMFQGNGKWLAKIQWNGELSVPEQRALGKLFESSPLLFEALQELLAPRVGTDKKAQLAAARQKGREAIKAAMGEYVPRCKITTPDGVHD